MDHQTPVTEETFQQPAPRDDNQKFPLGHLLDSPPTPRDQQKTRQNQQLLSEMSVRVYQSQISNDH